MSTSDRDTTPTTEMSLKLSGAPARPEDAPATADGTAVDQPPIEATAPLPAATSPTKAPPTPNSAEEAAPPLPGSPALSGSPASSAGSAAETVWSAKTVQRDASAPTRGRVRTSTLMWGLILLALGGLLIAVGLGARIDLVSAFIVIVGGLGFLLLILALVPKRSRAGDQ